MPPPPADVSPEAGRPTDQAAAGLNPADGPLARKTMRNVAWLGSSQALRQGISILTTIVLARFLGPAEYGIFAMTIFVNELAQLLVDFGIGSALIQRKQVDQRLLSSCFWINLGVGACAALAMVALGPWIARYFGQPVIQSLLVVSGLNLMLAALAVLPQALLSRQLAFGHVAIGTVVGSITGALAAVALAFGGAGVWALVLQPLIGTAVNTLYLYARSRWLPQLLFDFAAVRGVLDFSGQLLLGSMVGHFTRNLPSLILGPAMGVAQLGLITMSQTIAWLPVAQFSQAVVRATFPVFARLQDEMGRFRDNLYKASGLIGLLAFPVLTGLAVMAGDLVPLVFGAKWAPASPLVSVLCALSIVQCVATLSGTALLAAGRADVLLRLSLVGLPVMAGALWAARDGSAFDGVLALVAATIVLQLATLTCALRAIGGRWRDYLAPLLRPLLCCVLMAAAMLPVQRLMSDSGAWPRLLTLGLAGATSYLSCSLLLNRAAGLQAYELVRKSLSR